LFCTIEPPNKLRHPCYGTPLCQRWQRVAIMQAAGIAQSWRSNLARAERAYREDVDAYQEELQAYQQHQARDVRPHGERTMKAPTAPVWREWNTPTLRQWCLQANVNVARLE